jgi:YhgE/Pip-like protein
MFKNKLIWLSPILALVVIFIFSLTIFPSVQPKPKNLPIAIVNEDQGIQISNQPKLNMGQTIVERIQKTSETSKNEDQAVKWIIIKNKEQVQKGLNNQSYYGSLVIPKDFSAKQASLRTPIPSSPEVEIFINQGMNTAAATIAGQILNGVVDNINNNVRTGLLKGFEAQGATLTIKQASSLVTPIKKTVTNVNEIRENSANGNAPVSLFQPLWMACIASAAIIYFATSKLPIHARKERFFIQIGRLMMGAVIAFVIGFGLTWIADRIIGLNIGNLMDTALFLTITSFSFFLMISAVISLFGLRAIALFALLLFFGAPLLSMAPEIMPSFYRDWVHSWLPMRFMVDGLRELFFFGKGLTWNTSVSTLTWIGIVSMFIILATGLKSVVVKDDSSKS